MDVSQLFAIVFASSGFWAFLQFLITKKTARKSGLEDDIKEIKKSQEVIKDAVKGLSHDRIIERCGEYADRGYVTDDEFDDLYHNLWKPYHDGLGGNGSAQRAFERTTKLPRQLSENV